jgi:hypothetical protein
MPSVRQRPGEHFGLLARFVTERLVAVACDIFRVFAGCPGLRLTCTAQQPFEF